MMVIWIASKIPAGKTVNMAEREEMSRSLEGIAVVTGAFDFCERDGKACLPLKIERMSCQGIIELHEIDAWLSCFQYDLVSFLVRFLIDQ
jgi:hypothetical protein